MEVDKVIERLFKKEKNASEIFSEVIAFPKTETALSSVQKKPFDELLLRSKSFDDFENNISFLEGHPEFAALKTPAERRKFLDEKMREILKEREVLEEKKKRHSFLTHNLEAFNEMFDWSTGKLALEKPEATMFRAMRKEANSGNAIYFAKEFDDVLPAMDFEKEVFKFAEIMVVQHDWAAAFDDKMLEESSVKLPYDVCAFEFCISGRHTIVLTTQLDEDIYFSPIVRTTKGWVFPNFAVPIGINFDTNTGVKDDRYIYVINLLGKQIKAICIALDAEVAKSEIVREPHIGEHGKNLYASQLSYRVVNLARRATRPLSFSSNPSGRKIRLHFRRGHWRHFATFKTWIKWCLVGDPELGFIDKEYRL